MASDFLVAGGTIDEVAAEPTCVGSVSAGHGCQGPAAFLACRVNGQYIMEALASSVLFTTGSREVSVS